MKNPPSLMLVVLLIAGQTVLLRAAEKDETRAASSQGWKLVWSDEFDKEGPPDPGNWKFEIGFIRQKEFQWYQPENASCHNGLLILEGRSECKPNPNYDPDSKDWRKNRKSADYTSASLTTEGLHSWLYGRFEMRGRIDTRAGLWPCFWTLGVEGKWPNRGEIDIMEYYGGLLKANAAWASETNGLPKWSSVRRPIEQFPDQDWSKKFHIWRMDWNETSIRLYVDEILLNTVDLATTLNAGKDGDNPFRKPHFVLLSLPIGGKRGGDPSQTKFPARFEVDYVRVYQKESSPDREAISLSKSENRNPKPEENPKPE